MSSDEESVDVVGVISVIFRCRESLCELKVERLLVVFFFVGFTKKHVIVLNNCQ